jgi:phage-related protein
MEKEYNIEFYRNSKGYSQIEDWLDELESKIETKAGRSLYRKVDFAITSLEKRGFGVTMPTGRSFKGYKLFELRPLPYRILYGAFNGDEFVLLHSFRKKTNHTPQREIEQALRELDDWITNERWKER